MHARPVHKGLSESRRKGLCYMAGLVHFPLAILLYTTKAPPSLPKYLAWQQRLPFHCSSGCMVPPPRPVEGSLFSACWFGMAGFLSMLQSGWFGLVRFLVVPFLSRDYIASKMPKRVEVERIHSLTDYDSMLNIA